MSRRIAIELTSNKGDGTWTWRAAGAREPRGVISADLLPKGAGISSVFTAEVQSDMDGVAVLAVIESEDTRTEPETIEVFGTGKHSPGVNFKGGSRGGKRKRGADARQGRYGDDGFGDDGWTRQGRSGLRGQGSGRPRQGKQGGHQGGHRSKDSHGGNQDRQTRLRPGREHRKKWLASAPPEHAQLAEQIASGKLRTSERQKNDADASGTPDREIEQIGPSDANSAVESANRASEESVFNTSAATAESKKDIAAQLLAEYRTAEWQDRADLVLANFEEIDLAEVRMLVADSDAYARTPETRSQADEAKEKLTERTERKHGEWLADLAAHLSEGRVLRALRQSGQPPKAGVPLPLDLVKWLTTATADILTPEAQPERWSKTLQALAVSPVRRLVRPEQPPAAISPELTDTLAELAPRFPHIAALFSEKEAEEAEEPMPDAGEPDAGEPHAVEPAEETAT